MIISVAKYLISKIRRRSIASAAFVVFAISSIFTSTPNGTMVDWLITHMGNMAAKNLIISGYKTTFNDDYKYYNGQIECSEKERITIGIDIVLLPRGIMCEVQTACENLSTIPVRYFPLLGASMGPDPLWDFFVFSCRKMLSKEIESELNRRCSASPEAGAWC